MGCMRVRAALRVAISCRSFVLHDCDNLFKIKIYLTSPCFRRFRQHSEVMGSAGTRTELGNLQLQFSDILARILSGWGLGGCWVRENILS